MLSVSKSVRVCVHVRSATESCWVLRTTVTTIIQVYTVIKNKFIHNIMQTIMYCLTCTYTTVTTTTTTVFKQC